MSYRIVQRHVEDPAGERERVIRALLAAPAAIEPRYFYDALGCAIYGAICQLPEYYPTRTEVAIFQAHRAQIAEALGQGRQFIDLGAGDCCKALGWLPFINPTRYVAVDIAAAEIDRALSKMAQDFPDIEMLGVVTDFSRTLDLDGLLANAPATFFYPGSSIGNFAPPDAVAFLARIAALCAKLPESGLLIGVDTKKDRHILDAAYDDSLGITAAFNRNALGHLNRRFGFDFDLNGYAHRGFYNEALGRIEMHLESIRNQVVRIDGRERRFEAGERIHTENSYKYRPEEFEAMLREAGFLRLRCWQGESGSFAVFHAQ